MREGCSALRRGARSYFCLRRVTFFSWTRREVPRPGAGKFLYLSPTASFLSAAKEKRKRNAAKNYVFGFPCAASHGFYLVKISHANVVPRKFRLNVALSLLLFSLPLAAPRGNWRSGPIKASAPTEIPSALRILWGPTCVSALARVTKATSPVGADALVRPPAQAATTAQAARSDCAAVGGSAVLRMRRAPCGQAERAEGGTSGTLVTEILGAPQRETGKEELVKSLLAP